MVMSELTWKGNRGDLLVFVGYRSSGRHSVLDQQGDKVFAIKGQRVFPPQKDFFLALRRLKRGKGCPSTNFILWFLRAKCCLGHLDMVGVNCFKENILKHRHHTQRESIDNTNNCCIFSRVTIPVMLFHYRHFTNYDVFIHTK